MDSYWDVAEHLQWAKERVAEGWVQQKLATTEGVCTVGALQGVLARWDGLVVLHPTFGGRYSTFTLAIDMLRQVIPPDNSVAAWNDAPERSQVDVLDAFDRAIILAKEFAVAGQMGE